MPPMDEESSVIDKILDKRIFKTGSKKELQFLVSSTNKLSDGERRLAAKIFPNSGTALHNFSVEQRREK